MEKARNNLTVEDIIEKTKSLGFYKTRKDIEKEIGEKLKGWEKGDDEPPPIQY
jgi:hypothetical protein